MSHSQKTGQLVKLETNNKTSSHHETNPPEIQRRIQNQGSEVDPIDQTK